GDDPPAPAMEEGVGDGYDVHAVDHEHHDDAHQRNDSEELQPAAQQAGGEGEGHVGAKLRVPGARCQVPDRSREPPVTQPRTPETCYFIGLCLALPTPSSSATLDSTT